MSDRDALVASLARLRSWCADAEEVHVNWTFASDVRAALDALDAPPIRGRSTLDAVLRETVQWGCETFPNADPRSCAAHLLKEARELLADPTSAGELADVAMLLAHTAHRAGVDLAAAVRAKLKVNRAREWGEPDADGVIEHTREPKTN